jgi:hypothetical protein
MGQLKNGDLAAVWAHWTSCIIAHLGKDSLAEKTIDGTQEYPCHGLSSDAMPILLGLMLTIWPGEDNLGGFKVCRLTVRRPLGSCTARHTPDKPIIL